MRRISSRAKIIILLILVIAWMIFIFSMSSDVASESNRLSSQVTDIVIDNLENLVPHYDIDAKSLNHIIRKNAHVFLYLVLSLLILGLLGVCKFSGSRLHIYTILICVVYAMSDEVHQLRVPGRGGQFIDVMIDFVGISIGLVLHCFLCKLLKWNKHKGD